MQSQTLGARGAKEEIAPKSPAKKLADGHRELGPEPILRRRRRQRKIGAEGAIERYCRWAPRVRSRVNPWAPKVPKKHCAKGASEKYIRLGAEGAKEKLAHEALSKNIADGQRA